LFTATWVNTTKSLVLKVNGADTKAGHVYRLRFTVTNGVSAQQSPQVMIESSGIVIQPSAMTADKAMTNDFYGTAANKPMVRKSDDSGDEPAPAGASAPLFIVAPRLVGAKAKQTFTGAVKTTAAFPGDKNSIELQFTPTVVIKAPEAGTRTSIIVRNLRGVVAKEGAITLGGTSCDKFTDCLPLNTTTCSSCRGYWMSANSTLLLNVRQDLAANTPVAINFNFTNALAGQNPPAIDISMASTSASSEFDIAPTDVGVFADVKDDQRPLLIKPSASFTRKHITHSTQKPGETNVIELDFQPEYELKEGSTITVTGLLPSATQDGTLKLLPAADSNDDFNSIKRFNSEAAWFAATGTLVMRVAKGQTMPNDRATKVRFELLNPRYSQAGPPLSTVLISARGTVPLAATSMQLATTPDVLSVTSATFTEAKINQTSFAPGANNEIKVRGYRHTNGRRLPPPTTTTKHMVASSCNNSIKKISRADRTATSSMHVCVLVCTRNLHLISLCLHNC
jgi:hypothetical protein